MNIRAIVLTHNEGSFIADCLRSLTSVTDDVLVFDSGSTDDTVAVAQSLGAQVIELPWLGFPQARNIALDCSLVIDWVLFVDADERIPQPLAAEILKATESAPDNIDGFVIPRRNVVCGRIMRSGNWWPDHQFRVLRPTRCRYDEDKQVHEYPLCCNMPLALNNPIIHLNNRTWGEFTRKQFHYARLASKQRGAPSARQYMSAPYREFRRRQFREKGSIDGFHGLAASAVLSAAEFYRVWCARRNDD